MSLSLYSYPTRYYVVYVFEGAGLTGRRANLIADSVQFVLNVTFTGKTDRFDVPSDGFDGIEFQSLLSSTSTDGDVAQCLFTAVSSWASGFTLSVASRLASVNGGVSTVLVHLL